MSCLRYLYLFAHSGVQHILCCVSVCFSSSCVSYVVHFRLPLWYSLTFIMHDERFHGVDFDHRMVLSLLFLKLIFNV